MNQRQLLTMIGQRNPASYDFLFPHGPILAHGGSQAQMNPQPLRADVLGAAAATEFIQTARMANRFGFGQEVAFEDLDDWCPTKPKKFKWPVTWPPIPEPEPHPEWFADYHLAFAARLAAASEKLESTELRASIDKAIDRSMEAIETSMKTMGSKKS